MKTLVMWMAAVLLVAVYTTLKPLQKHELLRSFHTARCLSGGKETVESQTGFYCVSHG